VRVHVGLAALLFVSYRCGLARLGLPVPGARKRKPANEFPDKAAWLDVARDWLPDPRHYNYLLQHAREGLAHRLELASAAAKAGQPELQVFSGYSRLDFTREQLVELMGRMSPKMMEGLRTFLPAGVEGQAEKDGRFLSFGWRRAIGGAVDAAGKPFTRSQALHTGGSPPQ